MERILDLRLVESKLLLLDISLSLKRCLALRPPEDGRGCG